jgi:hypothetical protein
VVNLRSLVVSRPPTCARYCLGPYGLRRHPHRLAVVRVRIWPAVYQERRDPLMLLFPKLRGSQREPEGAESPLQLEG